MQVAIGKGDKGFESLGVSAAELAGMNAAEQFIAIAGGLSQISNESERAATAQAIFGRSWRDVDAFLRRAAATMEESRKAIAKFGLQVTDADKNNLKQFKKTLVESHLVVEGVSPCLGEGVPSAGAGMSLKFIRWSRLRQLF